MQKHCSITCQTRLHQLDANISSLSRKATSQALMPNHSQGLFFSTHFDTFIINDFILFFDQLSCSEKTDSFSKYFK